MKPGYNLTVRTAPCPQAPPVQMNGKDLVLPSGTAFQYTDVNSKQVSACSQYGLFPDDNTTCWIQGNYQGTLGWVPRAVADNPAGFPTAVCSDTVGQTVFVDGIGVIFFVDSQCGCFPAGATVLLPSGEVKPVSELQLGQQVRHVLSKHPARVELPVTLLRCKGPCQRAMVTQSLAGMIRVEQEKLPAPKAWLDIVAYDVYVSLPAQALAGLCQHRTEPIPTAAPASMTALLSAVSD